MHRLFVHGLSNRDCFLGKLPAVLSKSLETYAGPLVGLLQNWNNVLKGLTEDLAVES